MTFYKHIVRFHNHYYYFMDVNNIVDIPQVHFTKYQAIVREKLGRITVVKNTTSIHQLFKAIATDATNAGLDLFDNFPMLGFLLFKKHVFLNPQIFAPNVNCDLAFVTELIRLGLINNHDKFPKFSQMIKPRIEETFDDWDIYALPKAKNVKILSTLITHLKINDISVFETTHQYIRSYQFFTQEIQSIEVMGKELKLITDYGNYYMQQVPEERKSTKDKCWLFK